MILKTKLWVKLNMSNILNYKRLYKSLDIKKNVDKLTNEELKNGFLKLIGYSNDMNNFINAVELDLLQEGFLSQFPYLNYSTLTEVSHKSKI